MTSERNIVIGGIYQHYSGDTIYKVVEIVHSAERYEQTGKIGKNVIYTQLNDGKLPAGTRWTRSVKNFLDKLILMVNQRIFLSWLKPLTLQIEVPDKVH